MPYHSHLSLEIYSSEALPWVASLFEKLTLKAALCTIENNMTSEIDMKSTRGYGTHVIHTFP